MQKKKKKEKKRLMQIVDLFRYSGGHATLLLRCVTISDRTDLWDWQSARDLGSKDSLMLLSVLQMSWASGNLWRNPLHKKWRRCKTKVRESPPDFTLISFRDCVWRLWTKHDCLGVKYSCFSLPYFVVFSILTFDEKFVQISCFCETKVLNLVQSSRALLRSMRNLF